MIKIFSPWNWSAAFKVECYIATTCLTSVWKAILFRIDNKIAIHRLIKWYEIGMKSSKHLDNMSVLYLKKNKWLGLTNHFDISIVFNISVFEISKFHCIIICMVVVYNCLCVLKSKSQFINNYLNFVLKSWI